MIGSLMMCTSVVILLVGMLAGIAMGIQQNFVLAPAHDGQHVALQELEQALTDKATRIMLEVHTKGKGVCGVFTYEIAETKVAQVTTYARDHQHPLMCTLEEA